MNVQLLKDPRLFNYFIICIYACTAIWWACHRKWPDVFYWLSALAITATVTWGYKH